MYFCYRYTEGPLPLPPTQTLKMKKSLYLSRKPHENQTNIGPDTYGSVGFTMQTLKLWRAQFKCTKQLSAKDCLPWFVFHMAYILIWVWPFAQFMVLFPLESRKTQSGYEYRIYMIAKFTLNPSKITQLHRNDCNPRNPSAVLCHVESSLWNCEKQDITRIGSFFLSLILISNQNTRYSISQYAGWVSNL
jgi:hypothetical protein